MTDIPPSEKMDIIQPVAQSRPMPKMPGARQPLTWMPPKSVPQHIALTRLGVGRLYSDGRSFRPSNRLMLQAGKLLQTSTYLMLLWDGLMDAVVELHLSAWEAECYCRDARRLSAVAQDLLCLRLSRKMDVHDMVIQADLHLALGYPPNHGYKQAIDTFWETF